MNTWLIEEWATSLRAGQRCPGTVDRYCYHVRTFARTHPDPLAVTVAQVEERLARCRTPEYARAVRVALHQYYAWAASTGVSTVDPTQGCPRIRIPRTLGRPAPEQVYKQAMLAADPDTRLMVMLAGQAGLRRFEIAQLHSGDVHGQWLRVVGKGRAQREVALTGALQTALAARPAGWVFPSPRRPGEHLSADCVGRKVSRALGAGWSAHTLRHRAASTAYTATHDLLGVSEQLGHKSVATTQRYIGPDRERQLAIARACG